MINLITSKIKKYKTNHMYKLKNINKPHKLAYGDWGIVAYESNIITAQQIEAARCCISRHVKKIGKVWVKIIPDYIVSKKDKDSRMGSGKGKIFKWLFILKPGATIFEATSIPIPLLIKIYKTIKKKITVKIKLIIKKNDN